MGFAGVIFDDLLEGPMGPAALKGWSYDRGVDALGNVFSYHQKVLQISLWNPLDFGLEQKVQRIDGYNVDHYPDGNG